MNNSPLKVHAVSLHRQLVDQLLMICQDGNMEVEKKLHTAVLTSEEFLDYLYELIPHRFDHVQDEILFFKSIKPLFTAEKEYHQRLYHAKIWQDDQFYGAELKRMEKLLATNVEFVSYYHNQHTYNDMAWFTQGQAPLPTSLCLSVWETNPKHTSARDGWVSGLMAVERYKSWLEAKML
ncbi:MAG: RteC domain-containing protein [Bacteroidota bacterium]